MASSRSTRRGSQYLANEQELNIGRCQVHDRQNEAFCEVCKYVVCPSCLMFGDHIGHKVLSPGQAVRLIRDLMDKANKAGKLSPDYSDRYLNDIRENKSKMQKGQNNVMAFIQEHFANIIKVLKTRRLELIEAIEAHFAKELFIVEESEKNWEEKEKIAKKIQEISQGQSDEELLVNCFMILNGIDSLDSPVTFKNLSLLESIDFQCLGLDIEDLLQVLKGIGKLSDKKILQFRS